MLKVAVIGATGAVGREMLTELEHYGIQCEAGLFASAKSAGKKLKFRGEEIQVKEFSIDALKGYHYALMSAGGEFSKTYARQIADQGCVVIDNSSAWRMSDGVPLVVPEVNAHAMRANASGIVANPNCSTIQLVMSLKPLADNFGLEQVNVSSYQSVSGSGQAGIEELSRQASEWVDGKPFSVKKYTHPIFNNLIPAIDVLRPGGHCFEEEKMVLETKKIMEMPNLEVLATTVRVPVMNCHSESVTVKLSRPVRRQDLIAAFADLSGIHIRYEDRYESFAYPLEMAGKREVIVCRMRLPFGHETSQTVQYWNVADNLKKGAATNAVQILHCLLSG